MMYLLDTHTLLWYLWNMPELSFSTSNIISNSENVFVSIASLWEIAIKKNLGKLKIDYSISDIKEICKIKHITFLQIKSSYLDKLTELPLIHRDPFDRLIISQAITENLTIITRDTIIPQYPVKTVW